MRHTISLLVENEYGMLARIAGLFSARGYQIDTLCVAPTLEDGVSRMTLTTHGNDHVIEQILQQSRKMVRVIEVTDLTASPHVEREMVMLTVNAHQGIERQLLAALAVELTYAGSAGKHIVFCYNPNEVQPGIGSQESRRLIQPLNRLNNMLQCDPRNRSTYHSGQLKLTQRFRGGLQLLGSYTYGKSLDYGGSAASGAGGSSLTVRLSGPPQASQTAARIRSSLRWRQAA